MDSDTTLIERFRLHGDETAFNQLVERHKRDAYRLAYRVAGNHEDAHDLAQEAFIRVYRSLERFRGDSSFRTWLYRIVMNLSLNHVKRARRHTDGHVAVEDVSLPVPARGLTSVLAEEERRRLSDAIERLPERQRRTLILKTYEELKYTEISAIMGCSVGTAKANFFHAVRGLRRLLGVGATPASEATASEQHSYGVNR